MEGLKIAVATAWEQIEAYTAPTNSCISPTHYNWGDAKESWEKDVPSPIYMLLDHKGRKGYIRFLAVAGFLYSDFYKMKESGGRESLEDFGNRQRLNADIWLEAVRFLGQPCLVSHSTYGGRSVKWIGYDLPYKRVNCQPVWGSSLWLIFPEDIGGVTKDIGPTTVTAVIDC